MLGGLCYVAHAVNGRWVVIGGSFTCYVIYVCAMFFMYVLCGSCTSYVCCVSDSCRG